MVVKHGGGIFSEVLNEAIDQGWPVPVEELYLNGLSNTYRLAFHSLSSNDIS